MNFLSNLQEISGSRKKSKRVGRGIGSGKGGHNSTFGSKGQSARTGNKIPPWFEGGQTPITKRMPYIKGFTNHNRLAVFAINLANLKKYITKSDLINPDFLYKEGVLPFDPSINVIKVKLLGRGILEKAANFEGFIYSRSAKEKIEKSGGKVS